MSEDIKINISIIKENVNKAFIFLKQKKVINIIIIALMLFLLIGSCWIRLQNLPLLKDQTTGETIPLALDPFYFLRIAETISEQGSLPKYDLMRGPFVKAEFSGEILPFAVVFIHKITSVFDNSVTLQYIDVLSPVIFYILGLITFFFLIYSLTKSKITALISSIFLAIIPTYLYRTMAGFADHESIGIFAFFLALLGYTFAMKFLDKEKKGKKPLLKTILFGLLVGFLSAFTIASWGGVANFIFMIIPLSFGIFWLIKVKNLEENKKKLFNFLVFYMVFFVSAILFGLIYGFDFSFILDKVVLGTSSLINGVILIFLISDFLMIKYLNKISFIREKKLEKYRLFFSLGIVIILGIILLAFKGTNIFSFISGIFNKLLQPFGGGRLGITVAENKQPFLNEWIGQLGKIFFWLFFGGLITIGTNIASKIRHNKHKILFVILWIIFISGILFSRISSTSIFNGTNFISKLFYFGSLILFIGYSIRLYFKEKINLKPGIIIIFSWALFMLISARGAIRFFFLITPFVCFSVGYLIYNLFNYIKKSRDELLRVILGIILVIVIILSIFSFNSFIVSSSQQAKYTGPSANIQWQNAMSWVRENTPQNSLFVHWWDYGYWVQYLGERATAADGGQIQSKYNGNHKIGRYILTTPYPETALSFFKTMNVSYLLIDPTDIGKYPAYSSIGSDESGRDRISSLPTMFSDPKQIKETSTSKIRVYQGGMALDEDIVYKENGKEIFLPEQKTGVIGVILETIESGNTISFQQPQAVFFYNQQQIRIPFRYVYFDNKIIDFKQGLESTAFIVPLIQQTNQGVQIDKFGTLIYLSPKVSKSLVAQLYLMNDPFGNYKTIQLAHSESDPYVNLLNSQIDDFYDFVYFNGFRGPIKIWETTDIPEEINIVEEFYAPPDGYGTLDDLKFEE